MFFYPVLDRRPGHNKFVRQYQKINSAYQGVPMTTDELLQELVNIQAQYDLLVADRETAMQSILTPVQVQQMADVDEEFEDVIQTAVEKVEALREQLKASVLKDEKSCKTDTLEALFVGGRQKWDDKLLNDMVFDHPPISNARLPKKPYVTIRNRK